MIKYTMRSLLITILTLALLSSCSQTVQQKTFEKTEYINGNLYRQLYDTIRFTNEKIDIYFCKNHFNSPYYLPDKFIDKQRRNKKISVWEDPKGKKDYKLNWQNIYIYDSLGRVINYSYSGCFVCSSLPYNYNVTYNSRGQVTKITEEKNSIESFKFYYNDSGDIMRFEEYSLNKLATVVKLMN